MDFKLSALHPSQIPQAVALWDAGWHEAHDEITPPALYELRTTASFTTRLTEHLAQTKVACVGEDVLGFCIVKHDEIYQMYVGPKARGSGVAQALMQEAEARIKALGHSRAWLACAVGNNRAARFYEKAGWVNTGISTEVMDTSNGPFPLEVWRFEKPL